MTRAHILQRSSSFMWVRPWVYGLEGHWRRTIYWTAAALTVMVTF